MRKSETLEDKNDGVLKNFFGRIDDDGNVVVFENDGVATRMDGIYGLYPVDSDESVQYEHPEGIVITMSDAKKIGLELE